MNIPGWIKIREYSFSLLKLIWVVWFLLLIEPVVSWINHFKGFIYLNYTNNYLTDTKEVLLHNFLRNKLIFRESLDLFACKQIKYGFGLKPTSIKFNKLLLIDFSLFPPYQNPMLTLICTQANLCSYHPDDSHKLRSRDYRLVWKGEN